MTLRQLRTFKAVADLSSFSLAAQQLRLSQPSVSYQVKELEEALGLPLLDRLGKRVQLTEAGTILYSYARPGARAGSAQRARPRRGGAGPQGFGPRDPSISHRRARGRGAGRPPPGQQRRPEPEGPQRPAVRDAGTGFRKPVVAREGGEKGGRQAADCDGAGLQRRHQARG